MSRPTHARTRSGAAATSARRRAGKRQHLTIGLEPGLLDLLDRLRADKSRSDYINAILGPVLKRRKSKG